MTRARNHTDDVEWSAEDATRTEFDFLCRCIEAAIKAGATTINLPDTVGYAVPEEYRDMFRRCARPCRTPTRRLFSVHCHNDLGLAVAELTGRRHDGARQIECTINGIGERAGNAALEECVMAMKGAGQLWRTGQTSTNKMLTHASKMVSSMTGVPVQYNKAIVGKNAFAHESGIDQDGMIKNARPTRR